MRRVVLRSVEVALLPVIGLVAALSLAPERASLEVHVFLLVLLGVTLLVVVGSIRRTQPRRPSGFDASLRTRVPEPERPASLVRLERELTMAGHSSFDTHYRLRPTLVELASALLASRRGIDLERDPAAAHTAVGDDVWELIRPGRPTPPDRLGRGIDPSTLERVVTALEGL